MWIRSQDGIVLVKAALVQAVDPRLGNGERRSIQAYGAGGCGKSVGQYDSEVEALMVLDELEFALVLGAEEARAVFQMPDKGLNKAAGE